MNKYLAILGREHAISIAELERVYGAEQLTPFGDAVILEQEPDLNVIGGCPKIGEVIQELDISAHLDAKLVDLVQSLTRDCEERISLGLSFYNTKHSAKEIGQLTIRTAKKLRTNGVRIRAIPNPETALNTGQVWHNRLDKKPNIELLVVAYQDKVVIAKTTQVQDIESYTFRDRSKPTRDAKSGMLPPKLAQTMINLANPKAGSIVYDPFVGSGTVLMEALMMGYQANGSDIDKSAVLGATKNLEWLIQNAHPKENQFKVSAIDAQRLEFAESPGGVVSEVDLGPPLGPHSHPIIATLIEGANNLIGTSLETWAATLPAGTPLCLAIPAWYLNGRYYTLPLVDELARYGYNRLDFKHIESSKLIYRRPDQIVARQLLVIERM